VPKKRATFRKLTAAISRADKALWSIIARTRIFEGRNKPQLVPKPKKTVFQGFLVKNDDLRFSYAGVSVIQILTNADLRPSAILVRVFMWNRFLSATQSWFATKPQRLKRNETRRAAILCCFLTNSWASVTGNSAVGLPAQGRAFIGSDFVLWAPLRTSRNVQFRGASGKKSGKGLRKTSFQKPGSD